jgi:hypothetical protein
MSCFAEGDSSVEQDDLVPQPRASTASGSSEDDV